MKEPLYVTDMVELRYLDDGHLLFFSKRTGEFHLSRKTWPNEGRAAGAYNDGLNDAEWEAYVGPFPAI